MVPWCTFCDARGDCNFISIWAPGRVCVNLYHTDNKYPLLLPLMKEKTSESAKISAFIILRQTGLYNNFSLTRVTFELCSQMKNAE